MISSDNVAYFAQFNTFRNLNTPNNPELSDHCLQLSIFISLAIANSNVQLVDTFVNCASVINIGGPAMKKALVVDEAAKMSKEEGIDMLCAVGLVAANKGYFVWNSEPCV